MRSMLYGLLPAAVEVTEKEGRLPVERLTRIAAEPGLERFAAELAAELAGYGLSATVGGPETAAPAVLAVDGALPAEGFRLTVTADGVRVAGGGPAGVFYGVGALRQMLALALIRGWRGAALDCGEVVDRPACAWRGFMLDCARHFQPAEAVKALLRQLAAHRINVFHWHLTDNDGWRFPVSFAPELASIAARSSGQYTREEIADIRRVAAEHFIRIVPELDIPGHSHGVLERFPQLACDPADIGSEFCLGNPEGKKFLGRVLRELVELFPDSPLIHLGGDEAATAHWEKCPRCRAALAASGKTGFRELEADFMREMCGVVRSLGRQAVVWATDADMPPEVTVQCWLDIHQFKRTIANGNASINSVHTSYYFDYPRNEAEPQEPWMFGLPESSVYMAEPAVHYGDKLTPTLRGCEACLWTETVPPWRLTEKILPRLPAFAEVAWSRRERREWYDFLRRRTALEAAGWFR